MTSTTRKKFDEWLNKVEKSLDKTGKASTQRLPEEFKFLKYWAEKLKFYEPKDFASIEKEYMNIAGCIGDRLYIDNLGYLKKAETHAVGTKARLNMLLAFVYQYSHYNQICFIEAGQEKKVKEHLKPFWDSYGYEVMANLTSLSGFQIESVSELAAQSKAAGIPIKNEWSSILEEISQPEDHLIITQVKNQLKTAEQNLAQEDTISALVLAVQAVELVLRDFCVRFGPDEDVLTEWRFNEYVGFLSENGYVSDIEKGNLLRFNDWRNCAKRFGLEPSVRITRLVIDEIVRFIEEHSY